MPPETTKHDELVKRISGRDADKQKTKEKEQPKIKNQSKDISDNDIER